MAQINYFLRCITPALLAFQAFGLSPSVYMYTTKRRHCLAKTYHTALGLILLFLIIFGTLFFGHLDLPPNLNIFNIFQAVSIDVMLICLGTLIDSQGSFKQQLVILHKLKTIFSEFKFGRKINYSKMRWKICIQVYAAVIYILGFGGIGSACFYHVSKLPDLLLVYVICGMCRTALLMRLVQYTTYLNLISDRLVMLNQVLCEHCPLSTDTEELLVKVQDMCIRLWDIWQHLNLIFSRSLMAIMGVVIMETVVDAQHLYSAFLNEFGICYHLGRFLRYKNWSVYYI